MTIYKDTKPIGPISSDFTGPGPIYNLPGLTGDRAHDPRSVHARGPSFSIAGKVTRRKREDDTPGPKYNTDKVFNRGKDDCVGASMKGRYSESTKHESSPGPGAYAPDFRSQTSYSNSPAYSMGLKTKPRRTRVDDLPGPNAYLPDASTTSAYKTGPAYSLRSRHAPSEKADNEPSPAQYNPDPSVLNKGRVRAPEYSLQSRNRRSTGPGGESAGPGPGAYSTDTVGPAALKYSPSWSFGVKPASGKRKNDVPGPGSYAVQDNDVPGSKSAPAYSIAGKRRARELNNGVPGAGKYFPDAKMTQRGRDSGPSYSISGKAKSTEVGNDSPGPQAYNTDTAGGNSHVGDGPSYSIGSKPKSKRRSDDTPAPNNYLPDVNTFKQAPAYSIGGRHKQKDVDKTSPGPGAYNSALSDAMQPKGPAYSMSGRTYPGGKKLDDSPGPAGYNTSFPPTHPDRGAPFGIRHSRDQYVLRT